MHSINLHKQFGFFLRWWLVFGLSAFFTASTATAAADWPMAHHYSPAQVKQFLNNHPELRNKLHEWHQQGTLKQNLKALLSKPVDMHLELISISDQPSHNHYIATLRASGGELGGKKRPNLFGVQRPDGHNHHRATWYPHGTRRVVKQVSEFKPAGAFQGLATHHGQMIGASGTVNLPNKTYTNPVLSQGAFSQFDSQGVGASWQLGFTETMASGVERQVSATVRKTASVQLTRPHGQVCQQGQVEGQAGIICTLRQVQGQQLAKAGQKVKFKVKVGGQGSEKLRYRAGHRWLKVGQSIPVSKLSNSRAIKLFVPAEVLKQQRLQLQGLDKSEAKKRLRQLARKVQLIFYTPGQPHNRFVLAGIKWHFNPDVTGKARVLSRLKVLLVDDEVTQQHYLTTLTSRSNDPKQKPLLYGVEHPKAGERNATWYLSSDHLQAQQQLPNKGKLFPATAFAGSHNPQLSPVAWQWINAAHTGQSKLLRYKKGHTTISSHLQLTSKLIFNKPAGQFCKAGKVNGENGKICVVRNYQLQGQPTGHTFFALNKITQHAGISGIAIDKQWYPITQRISLRHFAQNGEIRVFIADKSKLNRNSTDINRIGFTVFNQNHRALGDSVSINALATTSLLNDRTSVNVRNPNKDTHYTEYNKPFDYMMSPNAQYSFNYAQVCLFVDPNGGWKYSNLKKITLDGHQVTLRYMGKNISNNDVYEGSYRFPSYRTQTRTIVESDNNLTGKQQHFWFRPMLYVDKAPGPCTDVGGLADNMYIKAGPTYPSVSGITALQNINEGEDLTYTIKLNKKTTENTALKLTTAIATGQEADFNRKEAKIVAGSSTQTLDLTQAKTVNLASGVDTVTVSIPTIDDSILETTTDGVKLTASIDSSSKNATGTIAPNDNIEAKTIDNPEVTEGETGVFHITLEKALPSQQLMYFYSYYYNATAGAKDSDLDLAHTRVQGSGLDKSIDLTASKRPGIKLPKGLSSFNVSMPTVTDSLVETDEVRELRVHPDLKKLNGEGLKGVMTIHDGSILVENVNASQNINEGENLTYTINLTGTTSVETLLYLSSQIIAGQEADFKRKEAKITGGAVETSVDLTKGQVLHIKKGVNKITLTVPTVDDYAYEAGVETLRVTANTGKTSNETPSKSGDGTVGNGTYNDGVQAKSMSAPTAAEGEDLEFTATFAEPLPSNQYMNLYAELKTATAADLDLAHARVTGTQLDQTVDLSGGKKPRINVVKGLSSFKISIPVKKDSVVESDETLILYTESGNGFGINEAVSNTGTITDSTVLVESITASTNIWEGEDLVYTIKLSRATTAPEKMYLSTAFSGGAPMPAILNWIRPKLPKVAAVRLT